MNSTSRVFDGLLVLQCRNGDRKAYLLLVRRWHQRFCRQAFWYTKDLDLAKDIAQDSWTVVFNKLTSLKDPNQFGSWALQIVTRKAIDTVRKLSRTNAKQKQYFKELKDDNELYGTDKTDVEVGDRPSANYSKILMKAINQLPENQQLVLRLFYLEEYSVIEISNILTVSKGTVKSRLFYAREKLKSILKLYKK